MCKQYVLLFLIRMKLLFTFLITLVKSILKSKHQEMNLSNCKKVITTKQKYCRFSPSCKQLLHVCVCVLYVLHRDKNFIISLIPTWGFFFVYQLFDHPRVPPELSCIFIDMRYAKRYSEKKL